MREPVRVQLRVIVIIAMAFRDRVRGPVRCVVPSIYGAGIRDRSAAAEILWRTEDNRDFNFGSRSSVRLS
jgi:hypothetical protein